MKTITIAVNVDGNEVSRNYDYTTAMTEVMVDVWGSRVLDMLDTIEKSNEVKF